MKISVIMSAYNAQNTIRRAIRSVLNLTYKDVELIVVNDCSTDDTEKIIKKYKDNRIVYIKHDVNLGAGCARNTGIKHATGDYIAFLDSDDYYNKEYLQTMANGTDDGKFDIVSSGYIVIEGKHKKTKKPTARKVYGNNYVKDDSGTIHFLNVQLIKRSLFDNVEYCKRRFIEDSSTFVKLLYYAKNRNILNYAGYNYVQNPNSLIHSSSEYKKYLYNLLCAKDTHLFFIQVGHQEMYDFGLFLLKVLSMNTPKKEDGFEEERKEIMEYIIKCFNSII
ncbi:GtrB [uncultured phage cr130_1]|uniref:GtrB n=1 Tax=uncultured phage cr130_1 TaxID=2772092 RepID=A0A7M1RVD0_9CAUD|nr:GtrB-like O-antigen conversion [uncultured phage cr130_1]QOR57649.1 GtrB [uncultured phage cr130_1]